MSRRKINRPDIPDFIKGGASQIVLKCMICGMEYQVWKHLEKSWPQACTSRFTDRQLVCGGRLRRK